MVILGFQKNQKPGQNAMSQCFSSVCLRHICQHPVGQKSHKIKLKFKEWKHRLFLGKKSCKVMIQKACILGLTGGNFGHFLQSAKINLNI